MRQSGYVSFFFSLWAINKMDAILFTGKELRTHLSNCDLNLFLHPSSTSLPSSPLFHPSFPFPDPALFTEKKIFFSFCVYVQFEDIDIEDKLDCFFVKWLKLDCSKAAQHFCTDRCIHEHLQCIAMLRASLHKVRCTVNMA